MQISAQFIPDANITGQHLSIYTGKICSHFLIICLIVGRLESRNAPICQHSIASQICQESCCLASGGSVQPCDVNHLYPLCMWRGLGPESQSAAQSALLSPEWSLHKPASGFSTDLLSCWSNLASFSHQESWWWHPPCGLPWAPWNSLQSDWQEGRNAQILWQLPRINYRPHFWSMGSDWQKRKLYIFSQFPLHPSCHHH